MTILKGCSPGDSKGVMKEYGPIVRWWFNGCVKVYVLATDGKYSLQGTTQGNGLTGGVPPVRFSM